MYKYSRIIKAICDLELFLSCKSTTCDLRLYCKSTTTWKILEHLQLAPRILMSSCDIRKSAKALHNPKKIELVGSALNVKHVSGSELEVSITRS